MGQMSTFLYSYSYRKEVLIEPGESHLKVFTKMRG